MSFENDVISEWRNFTDKICMTPFELRQWNNANFCNDVIWMKSFESRHFKDDVIWIM